MATDSDDSSSFPNKRRKTVSSTSKSKIEDDPNQHESQDRQRSTANSPSQLCIICLSDDGNSIRGEIDCCDHFFCFLCIMEWARVESRCPMCKRRFSTIRRPPKDGVFDHERVVKVPVRDQSCTPFGNTTTGPFDPYAHVQCSVCHRVTDDNLLLLCDLCDSAAHSYCVGLGHTVPEGDWFCHDCTVCRTEHADREMETEGDNQNIIPVAETHLTIFDIVQESHRPAKVSLHPNQLSTPVALDRGSTDVHEVTRQGARTLQTVADRVTQSNARTLQRCRHVHGHIRALRENWNALRIGSLSFPSNSFKSGSKSSQKQNIGALLHDRSGPQHSSSSTSCQHSTTQNGFAGSSGHERDSYDIDKAWKMMTKAKSVERSHERASCLRQASKLPSSKGSASKEATNISSSLNSFKNQQFGGKDLGRTGIEKQCKYYSLEKELEKFRSPVLEKQKQTSVTLIKEKQSSVTTKEIAESSEGLRTTHSPVSFKSLFSRNARSSIQGDVCPGNGSRPLQTNINGVSSNVTNEQNGSACLMTLVGSMPGDFDSFYAKPELSTSSSGKVDVPEGKVRLGKDYSNSNTRKDGAKSEIQSLVKLNLKLLSRDNQLGVDTFKEIARVATHTILAACGLEHRKSGIHSFPSIVCNHTKEIEQLHKSTLMPNSCRKCFCVFVKDVVNSIMFEKVGCAKSS